MCLDGGGGGGGGGGGHQVCVGVHRGVLTGLTHFWSQTEFQSINGCGYQVKSIPVTIE